MLKSNAAREKSSARFSGVGHGVALLLLVSGLLPQLLAAEKSARAPKDAGPKPASEANSIEALIRSTRPSVVVITQFGRDGRKEGEGTGFIVDAGGLIATSLHVIGEARPVSVQLADGRRFDVTEVFASDRKFDLALIRIAAKNLPALKLGDSDTLKQGAPVVAIGNPLGLRHSVVQGVVSARRDFDGIDMIQLAIPIEQGNSGGPLLDLKGRVHGVLTLKSALTPNLGFAMPVNLLKTLLEKPNPVPMTRWLHLGALSAKEWTPVFGARWRQRAGRIEVENPGDGFGGRAPNHPRVLSRLVRLAIQRGDYTEAISQSRKLISVAPSPLAYRTMGRSACFDRSIRSGHRRVPHGTDLQSPRYAGDRRIGESL